jgi:signal transduction histidine kinase
MVPAVRPRHHECHGHRAQRPPLAAARPRPGCAIALIGFASCAFALFLRASTMPPGSGTLRQYPLHSVVFGTGFPHAVDLTAGLVMLACGVWLVPRTIGGHSALARRNRELPGRVRRLSLARVAAVDTAAAELRRVERDLHDGAQARLIALGISLRATERLIRTDPDAAVALVAEARKYCTSIFSKLDLPPSGDDNRRVLAVLAYLDR